MTYHRSLLVLLAACGDSVAPAADAAIDAPGDTGPPHPIVGRWEREPYGYSPGDPKPIAEFEASGVYRYGTRTGVWIAEGDVLTTQTPPAAREKGLFYLASDGGTLVTLAALPTGPTTGLVGTWAGHFVEADGTEVANTFEFHADQTLAWTATRDGITSTIPATWELNGSSIHFVGTGSGAGITVGMKLVPDVAIGDGLYTRVAP